LAGFAVIAVAQEQYQRAAQLMGAIETQLTSLGIRLLYMDKMEYDRNLPIVREKLNKKILDKFWVEGRGMSLDEAIAFALEGI
jgi:hypothetical protein